MIENRTIPGHDVEDDECDDHVDELEELLQFLDVGYSHE